jgi:rubrerythrin
MLEAVFSLFVGTQTVVYECRECGRTVDGETDRCPACGTESIARYPVE